MPTVPSLTLRQEKGSPLSAAEGDNNLKILRNAINAVFALFGVVLKTDGTLKANAVNTAAIQDRAITQAKLAMDSAFYSTDAGAANVYKATFTPAPTDYATGLVVFLKAATTNTGASTLSLSNGSGGWLTVKDIKKRGSVALEAGDIVAGQVYQFVYDGTNWQLFGLLPLQTVTYVKKFMVDGVSIPAGAGIYAASHGLKDSLGADVLPTHVQVFIKCVTGEAGYVTGDILEVSSLWSGADYSPFASIQISTTQIKVHMAQVGFAGVEHATTGIHTALTRANWLMKIVATYIEA